MPAIKLATWNINSVRLRSRLVGRFLQKHAPDVLCLQETKVIDDLFPGRCASGTLGYVHQAINGQKGYHGVAILSRLPFRTTSALSFCGKDDSRHISAVFESGSSCTISMCRPAATFPIPSSIEKFAHKLDFLREMETCFAKQRDKRNAPIVLVGDLNVAPFENDVWSHKQLLNVVSHTPVETELLAAAKNAFDWIDVTRSFVPLEKKIYSWWSYRTRDWEASDRGRRLDHIWVSQGLEGRGLGPHDPARAARLGETIRSRAGDGDDHRLICSPEGLGLDEALPALLRLVPGRRDLALMPAVDEGRRFGALRPAAARPHAR